MLVGVLLCVWFARSRQWTAGSVLGGATGQHLSARMDTTFRQRLGAVFYHLQQMIKPLENMGCLQVRCPWG